MSARRFAIAMVVLMAVAVVSAGCSTGSVRIVSRAQASAEAAQEREARDAARAAKLEAERPRREAAVAAATEVLRRYVDARNEALAHPGDPAHDSVAETAGWDALDEHRAEVSAMSGRGVHQTGAARVQVADVFLVDLKGLPGVLPAVILDVCVDRSGVRRVDGAGREVAGVDSAMHGRLRIRVENTGPSPADAWRVTFVETADGLVGGGGTCPAS